MPPIPDHIRRPAAVIAALVLAVLATGWLIRPLYRQHCLNHDIRTALLGMTDVMGQEVAERIRSSRAGAEAKVVLLVPALGDPISAQQLRNEIVEFSAALQRRGIKSLTLQAAAANPNAHTFANGAVAGCIRAHPDAQVFLLYRALPAEPAELDRDRQCYPLAVYAQELKPYLEAGLMQWGIVFRYNAVPATFPLGRENFDPSYQIVTAGHAANLP